MLLVRPVLPLSPRCALLFVSHSENVEICAPFVCGITKNTYICKRLCGATVARAFARGRFPRLSGLLRLLTYKVMTDMTYDIFISYSRVDSAVVDSVLTRLEEAGFSVWIDRSGIESGDAFKRQIVKAIGSSAVVLFFSSEASNRSSWTAKEIGVAVYKKKTIIPILLDDAQYNEEITFDLINLDYVDYRNPEKRPEMLARLLKTLRNKCGKTTPETDAPEPPPIPERPTAAPIFPGSPKTGPIDDFLMRFFLPFLWKLFAKCRHFFSSEGCAWKVVGAVNLCVSCIALICSLVMMGESEDSAVIMFFMMFLSGLLAAITLIRPSIGRFPNRSLPLLFFLLPFFIYFLAMVFFMPETKDETVPDYSPNSNVATDSLKDDGVDSVSATDSLEGASSYMGLSVDSSLIDAERYEWKTELSGMMAKNRAEATFTVKAFPYSSISFDGLLRTAAGEAPYTLGLHLKKKYLEGVVEDEDGMNIGYVRGKISITGDVLTMTGRIVIMKGDDYQERSLKLSGPIPTDLKDRIEQGYPSATAD